MTPLVKEEVEPFISDNPKMLEDLFDNLPIVNKTDDSHPTLTLGVG
jgi:hypothetical protein